MTILQMTIEALIKHLEELNAKIEDAQRHVDRLNAWKACVQEELDSRTEDNDAS